jgi:hypothetical protein
MNAKYNPGSVFHGIIVNKKKTRKIKHEHFPKLPHVQQLINMRIYRMIQVLQRYGSLTRKIKVMDLGISTMTSKTYEAKVMMSLSQ